MSLKNIFFTSGMPRSGSTLLMNLLGQNPNFHVTPTNGLSGMVDSIRRGWVENDSFKAQGIDEIRPRIAKSIKGLISGFYEKELSQGKFVFDKSRNWISLIEVLEESFEQNIKIVVTVRDVREVLSSFEKIHRKDKMLRGNSSSSVTDRALSLLAEGSVVGNSVNSIKDAFETGVADRLIFLPFKNLTRTPEKVMEYLHGSLGIENFNYDSKNVNQVTHENDIYYKMNLHKVRKEIKPVEPDWEEILPSSLNRKIAADYADIIALSEGRVTF